jgi:hypothetical protein
MCSGVVAQFGRGGIDGETAHIVVVRMYFPEKFDHPNESASFHYIIRVRRVQYASSSIPGNKARRSTKMVDASHPNNQILPEGVGPESRSTHKGAKALASLSV